MTKNKNHRQPWESTIKLKSLLKRYFSEFEDSSLDNGRKVAWCSSIGPCELLLAMGFDVYYPENHGALLGTTRTATDLIPLAGAAGYSPDICSYLTSDIGAFLRGYTPLTEAYGLKSVPKPDLLLFNNNQCREVQDWFMFYARKLNVPIVGINSPRVLDEVKQSHIDAIVSQLHDIISDLEEASGHRFDIDRLREVVKLSKDSTTRWRKVLEYAARVPAPMTFFDHCIHMAPAVILRGKKEAVGYYDFLLEELENTEVAAVADEMHRIYWDGMPVWGKLRMLSNVMKRQQTAIVASTYCNSWIFDSLDPKKPLESMARSSLECFNVRSENYKETYIRQWTQFCKIDGIIFHDAKTCPYNTNSRFAMPTRLNKKLGLPALVIDGDLNDLRCFSEEQTKTNIEAFIEQLGEAYVSS